MIYITIILLSISAIAKGFCDAIQFHPSQFPFQTDWWLAKGEYAWNNRTWLEMYVFSFISDGWHLMDAVRIVSILLLIALLLVEIKKLKKEIDYYEWFALLLFLVSGYIIHGSMFEITFKLL